MRSTRDARSIATTGDVLTTSLDDYRMPGIADIPPIDLHFDEGGFDHVLGGSVGIGEVATVPTSAAIANAIRNAIGVAPSRDPAPARPAARLIERGRRRMTAAGTIVAEPGVAEFRASGTDLSERRRSGVSRGPLIDIAASPGDDRDRLGRHGRGADRRFDADRRHRRRRPPRRRPIRESPPRPAGLATPQIRRVATLGGNLAQRSRCWYFRNPRIDCLKKGGALPGARRQPPLWRRLRSRPLRRAASLDHGGGAAGL